MIAHERQNARQSSAPQLTPDQLVGPDMESQRSRDARGWAAAKLGLAPISPGHRLILTDSGLVAVYIADRLSEAAIDLHWSVITDVLAVGGVARLAEFEGFELDGHQLAYAAEQIPRIRTPRDREAG